jgi:hypothetical protein
MAIKVAMQNPLTKEIRLIKVGWSWVLFLFSTCFGIPLFLRKLTRWGFVCLATTILAFIFSGGPTFLSVVLIITQFVLAIFLGIKGNEITAKTYLENNWQFVDPNSDMTRYAKMQWGIFDQTPAAPTAAVAPLNQS